MLDQRLLKKLEEVNVPVIIHPKQSSGAPLYNDNYLDSVAYIFSMIYEDYFEHLNKVNYIPTHTGGLLDFLSHPVNTMYYINPINPLQGFLSGLGILLYLLIISSPGFSFIFLSHQAHLK